MRERFFHLYLLSFLPHFLSDFLSLSWIRATSLIFPRYFRQSRPPSNSGTIRSLDRALAHSLAIHRILLEHYRNEHSIANVSLILMRFCSNLFSSVLFYPAHGNVLKNPGKKRKLGRMHGRRISIRQRKFYARLKSTYVRD